jgi:hypothetical protein
MPLSTVSRGLPFNHRPSAGRMRKGVNMPRYRSCLLALGALVSVGVATPAAACCGCAASCAPVVLVPQPAPVVLVPQPAYVRPIYVVNQGPVFTGPNVVVGMGVEIDTGPVVYPYVGRHNYQPRWHRPAYRQSGSRQMAVAGTNRTVHVPYGTRRVAKTPLDPRAK